MMWAVTLLASVLGGQLPKGMNPNDNVEILSRPAAPVISVMPPIPRDVQGNPVTNLTVYLIPHSHDDTGWQRNVDQYYEEEVRYIYDTVVSSLRANSARRFIFVETAYFMRWWREQNADTQTATKGLISSGQIEFVNGGWCMADNASPSTDAQIDQVTLGHRYVHDVFGVTPKYAWSIDPFGLSASFALWFQQMNYTAWVFNRVDTRLKDLWHNESHLQFRWNPAHAGTDGVFSHVLDTHYGAPEITYKGTHYHFDFEDFGGLGGGAEPGSQLPVSDQNPSTFYNATVESEAEALVALARIRAAWYKLGAPHQKLPAGHGAILVPFGDDMKFQNANKQYSNMDRIIKQVNSMPELGVTLKYGTIGDYFENVDTAPNVDWPDFDGDFMPLGTNNNIYTSQLSPAKDADNKYWTGHYTTRPLMKGMAAAANGAKHTTEIAMSIACSLFPKAAGLAKICGPWAVNDDPMLAREVTSVIQHHDNIPGSSSPDAAVNLDVRLAASLSASRRIMETVATGASANATIGVKMVEMSYSAAGIKTPIQLYTADDTVTLWNSLAQARDEVIELPLVAGAPHGGSLSVTNLATGKTVASAVIPALPSLGAGNENDFTRRATLVFEVNIPPLSAATYTLSATVGGKGPQGAVWSCQDASAMVADISIDSPAVSVTFSKETARMASIKLGSTTMAVTQRFFQYHSASESNAYQFQPNRKQFPFGEPLEGQGKNASTVRICSISTAVASRVVQSFQFTPSTAHDCSTEASCKKSCDHSFNTCGDGTYYCCEAWAKGTCSGTHSCATNAGLHDCACTPSAYNSTGALDLMLEESVTVFGSASTPMVETSTEFVMLFQDREIVTRYETDIDNTVTGRNLNGTHAANLPAFETDSNGMLMMKRITNQTQWMQDFAEFHVTMAVAGNYYPLASPGVIRIASQSGTGKRSFAVLTDRAHGAASLEGGWVEVMMGRRCAEKGSISVDDTDHIIAKNWLFPSDTATGAVDGHRMWAVRVATPLIAVGTSGGAKTALEASRSLLAAGGLGGAALPPQVHLLTLDRVPLETTTEVPQNRVLLRVQHIFQAGESDRYSQAVTANVAALLAPLELLDVIEVPLNGVGEGKPADLTSVALAPLQIRTFEGTLQQHA